MLKKLLSLMDIDTIRRLRLNPINQVAELKLKEAAQPAFPCLLPVFQLMNWGLANGVRPTHNRSAAEELLEVLDMRLKSDPENPYPAD